MSIMDNVHCDSAPQSHFGIQEDGSVSIWNSANCCGRVKEYIGKPLLALEVSSGKVVAQIVSSKVSKVRILTQRAANIVESITNVLLKYPQPFISLALVSYGPRS